jgi:hypothetical protein
MKIGIWGISILKLKAELGLESRQGLKAQS